MAAGDLITQDWEMEFRGLLLGGDTPYSVVQVDGLMNLPEVVTSDQGRLRRDGLRPGDDFLGGRTVTVTLEIQADTREEFTAAVQDLRLALRPSQDEAPLVFQFPSVAGDVRAQVNARARRSNLTIGREWYYQIPLVSVEFYCTDPRIFSGSVLTASTSLPSGSGGLTFDATPPFTFGATSTGGSLALTNSGTYGAPVVFRVDGPVLTPRIIHEGLGLELALSLDVLAGEYVLLDTNSRTVLLGGSADRSGALSSASRWFDLEPGENLLSFRGATSGAGTLSAAWRSAWA